MLKKNCLLNLFTHIKHKNIFALSLALCAAMPNIFASLAASDRLHSAPPQSELIDRANHTAMRLKNALSDKKNQFLLGASTSEHQGNCANPGDKKCTDANCDWHRWASQQGLAQPSDPQYTCDWWNNYASYIQQLKEQFNLNAMRFSIEWPLVQPTGSDSFDEEVLDHYADVFVTMVNHGITPIVCFHHYTSPCWFADAGGFERIENADYFAEYCARVYEHIMDIVWKKAQGTSLEKQRFNHNWHTLLENNRHPLWATFNSPEGVAFKGYRNGEAPPALPAKTGLAWVSRVLCNMLEGHVQAYQLINERHLEQFAQQDEIPKPKIGFLKNITQLDPADSNNCVTRPLTKVACLVGNNLQNECIYNFFTTGTFKATNMEAFFKATGIITPHTNRHAPRCLDWIGVNYYSNQLLRGTQRLQEDDEEFKTDNSNYRIYPHGLKRAVTAIYRRIAQPVGAIKNEDGHPLPIYVTENGIATTDDAKRNRFYELYLNKLIDAIAEDGIPVAGYCTWTGFENYEWPNPHKRGQIDRRVYGLTTVSDDGKTLTPKEGAQFFQHFVQKTLES